MEHFYNTIKSILEDINIPPADAITKLIKYGKLIHTENSKYNLTGHKTIEDIIINLIIESLSPLRLTDVPRGTSVADMGTGAGIPGIPLAIIYPEIEFTLFDSNNKKIRFIDFAANELSIRNVKAIHGRLEEIAREKEFREKSDVVVSRAMSDVYMAGELGSPFIKPGGYLYLYISEKQKGLPSPVVDHLKKLSLDIITDGNTVSPLNIKTTSGLLLYKSSHVADIYPRRISAIRRGAAETERPGK